MAWREGRKRSGEPSLDVRLPSEERRPSRSASRALVRRSLQGGWHSDSSPRETHKRKRGGKGRSMLGRAFYWGAVLALWGVVAVIGVLVWIGITCRRSNRLKSPSGRLRCSSWATTARR